MAAERIAVITGASGGIGRALALALARSGFALYVTGRDQARLAETATAARVLVPVRGLTADLAREVELRALAQALDADAGRVDVLVHAAGDFRMGELANAQVDEFDDLFRTNVRAPYALTQALLPLLLRARGQVVFVNSSVGLSVSRPEVAQYAATKHALKAIADSVRAELGPQGIRVLSVYLGRTATPMQARICREENRDYRPNELLQPDDVAAMVVAALSLPRTAEVTDISIRPAKPA